MAARAEVKRVRALTALSALRTVAALLSAACAADRMAKTTSSASVAKNEKQSEPVDFEAAMGELEALVEKMEQGEFTLEDSIKQFERGMQLARACQQALRAAEQKVLKLAGDGSQEALQDFEVPDDS